MQIGYARVRTRDQQLALPLDALRQARCITIYEVVLSGATTARPVVHDLLTQLQAGDVVMTWQLDRLRRTLRDLLEVVIILAQRGVGCKSVHEQIETTASSGKRIWHRCATGGVRAGLDLRAYPGGVGGSAEAGPCRRTASRALPPAAAPAVAAETEYRVGPLSVGQIAAQLHMAHSTFSVSLRARGVPMGLYQPQAVPAPVLAHTRRKRGL
jgi:hypothetical protein